MSDVLLLDIISKSLLKVINEDSVSLQLTFFACLTSPNSYILERKHAVQSASSPQDDRLDLLST